MTLPLWLALAILLAHFVGDFLFQSDRVATGKSKSWLVLTEHVVCYAVAFLPFTWTYRIETWIQWFALNMAAHFLTDAVTSRWTSRLYLAGKRHWFFVVIGLDQLIHAATLLTTAAWVWGR